MRLQNVTVDRSFPPLTRRRRQVRRRWCGFVNVDLHGMRLPRVLQRGQSSYFRGRRSGLELATWLFV